MNSRRAHLRVTYDNVDISEDLRQHLKSWTYTDNLSGQADDLQINLEDREQLWVGDWMPDKGATLTSTIVRENWENEGDIDELPIGQFEVDELDGNQVPSTVSIKALSVPESSSLRGEEKSRAWEKTRLSLVANDIAGEAGLELFYDTDDDPEYDRVDEAGETDLEYLMRLCTDAGLCLKVSDAQIVIFDERKYEEQDAVDTIQRGEKRIKGGVSWRTTLTGVYKSCLVVYRDPSKGTTIRYEFTPPNPPKTSRVLVINERVTSVKEAERLAQKRLRQANKNGTTFSVTLMGELRFLAGLTLNLEDFGKLDGKYIITQAIHGQETGYETKLQLRRTLEGY